jgi:hypothetical protein
MSRLVPTAAVASRAPLCSAGKTAANGHAAYRATAARTSGIRTEEAPHAAPVYALCHA